MGGAGDADSRALAEPDQATAFGACGGRISDDAEPEWAWGAEVGSVEGSVDAKGGGEAPRTAGEVEQAGGLAVILHLFDAFKGLERADEDAAANSRDFCAHVEHEVVAVTEINVGVAAAKKHGAIARGWTAEVVRGGIALRVGFGFNDTPAEAEAREFADDDFADEKAGQCDGIRREFGTAEAADGNGGLGGYLGWQVRQSSEGSRKSNLMSYARPGGCLTSLANRENGNHGNREAAICEEANGPVGVCGIWARERQCSIEFE